MKKTINFRMSPEFAEKYGYRVRPGFSLGMFPIDVDLDSLSPAAAFIAQHITSTYILDELRDVNHLRGVHKYSMAERDRDNGVLEEIIQGHIDAFGDEYGVKKMTCELGFPILSRSFPTPESVIERTAYELKKYGCAKIVDIVSGDTFDLI